MRALIDMLHRNIGVGDFLIRADTAIFSVKVLH